MNSRNSLSKGLTVGSNRKHALSLKGDSWISFRVTDKAGNPLADVPYKITGPDNESVATGKTDTSGYALVENVDGKTCVLYFPGIDKNAIIVTEK